MTLVILWTALGLLCGCLIGNAANKIDVTRLLKTC